MFIQRTKLTILVCLLFGLLGGIGMTTMADKTKSDPQLPIRKMTVIIDKSQQEELFDQLRKFADKHAFAIRVAPTTPTGEDFIVEMWREDFKILGTNPFDPGTFKIGIYKNNVDEITSSYVDTLIGHLKNYIGEVQNAVFSE